MPSQRSGTKLLTRTEQIVVQKNFKLRRVERSQSGQPGSGREPWTDAGNESKKAAFAATLIQSLHDAAIKKYDDLNRKPKVKALPMGKLEGASAAAKRAVDNAFRDWVANAALPAADRVAQEKFTFNTSGMNANLVNATDPVARSAWGQPVSSRDMAKYLAFTDGPTLNLMAEHHFDASEGSGTEDERQFLDSQVLRPLINADYHLLYECDRLGYSSTRPYLRTVFVSPLVAGWYGTDENDQEPMQRKYEVFQKLIHEYIHILEYPLIPAATDKSMVFREGVCEWLTCQVITGLVASKGDELRDIIATVEDEEVLRKIPQRPENLRKFLGDYQPGYTDDLEAVKEVLKICGENGLKAAFFQGHMEFLGLFWRGGWCDGAEKRKDGTRAIPRPPQNPFSSVEAFAKATGLEEKQIQENNPGFALAADEWPEQVFLPTYHSHLTVVVGDDDTAETWKQISAQHNVSETRLQAANLVAADASVPKGTWLLVPDQEG